MEEVDKGCLMIGIGVSGWMFLLVPAYPGSPGQTIVCVCVCAHVYVCVRCVLSWMWLCVWQMSKEQALKCSGLSAVQPSSSSSVSALPSAAKTLPAAIKRTNVKPAVAANSGQVIMPSAQILAPSLFTYSFLQIAPLLCCLQLILNFTVFVYQLLPSVLWRCWLGGRKGIRPVKTEWWVADVVICLERGVSHKPGSRLPLLSAMPEVTLETLNRAATSFAARWTEAWQVWPVCLRLLLDSIATAIWTQAILCLSLAC